MLGGSAQEPGFQALTQVGVETERLVQIAVLAPMLGRDAGEGLLQVLGRHAQRRAQGLVGDDLPGQVPQPGAEGSIRRRIRTSSLVSR